MLAVRKSEADKIKSAADLKGAKIGVTAPGSSTNFFVDYLTTGLEPDELLTAIRIPKLGPDWGYRYEKFHRTAQSWSTVAVAALVRRDNGTVAEARIGLTNMGSVPVRAGAAEQAARGVEASLPALSEAAGHAAEASARPVSTRARCRR